LILFTEKQSMGSLIPQSGLLAYSYFVRIPITLLPAAFVGVSKFQRVTPFFDLAWKTHSMGCI
jgi:hypothetical protein